MRLRYLSHQILLTYILSHIIAQHSNVQYILFHNVTFYMFWLSLATLREIIYTNGFSF
jgi:hypothetical protein